MTQSGLLIFRAVADPRNSGISAKSREIPKKTRNTAKSARNISDYMSAKHIRLAIRPVLFTPNVQIYLETSSLQRVNNVPKLKTSQNYRAFLDERCEKLGTNHNVNSFKIRSFLERTVVERANDYPGLKNVKQRWSYRCKID